MEGIAFDITGRKLDTERIQRLDRVHALLSGINSVIVRVRDDQELVQEACRLAIVMGRFRCAWIGIVDRSAPGLRLAASHGADAGFLAELDATLLRDGFATHGVLRATLDARAPLVVNDVEHEGVRFPMLAALRQRGIRAYAILPLVANGDAIGVMGLYMDGPDSFDAAELDLLNEIAGDIAFGLDHIRKEEQITFLAYYDPLTGLANRSLFHDRLAAMLRKAEREGQTRRAVRRGSRSFQGLQRRAGTRERRSAARRVRKTAARLRKRSGAGRATGIGSIRDRIAARAGQAILCTQLIEAHLDLCTAQPFRVAGQ